MQTRKTVVRKGELSPVRKTIRAPVPAVELTPLIIAGLPDGRYNAGRGLYLEVRNNGRSRTWLFIMTVNGKRKSSGLGNALQVSQREAIEASERIRCEIRGEEWTAKEIEARRIPTLDEASEVVLLYLVKTRNWKHSHENEVAWRGLHRKYVHDILGTSSIDQVTKQQVVRLLNVVFKISRVTARILRRQLWNIFDYAIKVGWYQGDNPAQWHGQIKSVMPTLNLEIPINEVRELTMDRAKKAVKMCMESDRGQCKLLLFMFLTVQKVGCCTTVRWEDLDLQNAVWDLEVPGSGTAGDYRAEVPLCQPAVELLEDLMSRDVGLVFESERKRGVPFNLTKSGDLLKILTGSDVGLLSIRRLFCKWAKGERINPTVVRACLSKKIDPMLSHRFPADYLRKEQIKVMERWAKKLLAT